MPSKPVKKTDDEADAPTEETTSNNEETIVAMSIPDLTRAISEIDDLDVLRTIEGFENAKEKPRTGAKNALAERIELLMRLEAAAAKPAEEEAPTPVETAPAGTKAFRVIPRTLRFGNTGGPNNDGNYVAGNTIYLKPAHLHLFDESMVLPIN